MFSSEDKYNIAEKIQKILRDTNDWELPDDEIEFHLHVVGKHTEAWADIKNNGSVKLSSK